MISKVRPNLSVKRQPRAPRIGELRLGLVQAGAVPVRWFVMVVITSSVYLCARESLSPPPLVQSGGRLPSEHPQRQSQRIT
jgi:hypothetical protein